MVYFLEKGGIIKLKEDKSNLNWGVWSKYFYMVIEILLIIFCTKIFLDVLKKIIIKAEAKNSDKNDDNKNAVVELIKYLLTFAAYILAIVLILGALGVDIKDIANFLTKESQGPFKYVLVVIRIIIIFVLTKILIRVLSVIIDNFFEKQKKLKYGISEKKADTLRGLLKNTLRYLLYFISLLLMLEQTELGTKTLIAVTGAIGVAIGFGAQGFIKDVISGFLILFEDQFAVGDYISIDGMSGTVETIGLRITKIRDFSGELYIIPNGSIQKVTNKSRGNMRALVDVDVAYTEDTDKVMEVLNKTCDIMKRDFKEEIVEGPSVLGITKLGESGFTVRIFAMTKSMKQWNIENELRKRIKCNFDKEGIQIAYPTRIIINGDDEKNGKGV